jgi:hypothetical protein
MATTPLVLGSYGELLSLKIKQGADFGPHIFRFKNPNGTPVDLTGCVFNAQMRQKALDTEVVATFTCTVTDAVGGEMIMSMDSLITSTIPAGELVSSSDSKYVWDMYMTDSLGDVTPRYYGPVEVFRGVTRG